MDGSDKKTIWLIGTLSPSLPEGFVTIQDVLRVYYFHRLEIKLEKKSCISNLSKNLHAHYLNVGVTTIAPKDISRKIVKAIGDHESYKKSMYRENQTQRCNEEKFIDFLNERFEIFPKTNYHPNKKSKLESLTSEIFEPSSSEVQRSNANLEADESNFEAFDLDSDGEANNNDKDGANDADFESTLSKYQRRQLLNEPIAKEQGIIQKIIDSPEVSSVLDRTGYSAPKFSLLCAAMAGAVGENVTDCSLSSATCYRRRKMHRDLIVTTIKDDYISTSKSSLVLHWDGKKLEDTTNDNLALRKKKVEKLAVVVSGTTGQKIITVAKTENGTGIVISDTVFEHIVDWKLLESVVAVCTDTTATNTGHENGSVVLFQLLAGRNMLYFACRHHVDELTIGAVFVGLFGESTGPSPTMFEQFKNDWHMINQLSFKVS